MPPQEPGHVQVTSRSRPGHVQVTSRSYHHLVLIISDGGVAAGDGCGAGGGVHPHCVLRRQRLGPLLLQIRQFRGTPPPPAVPEMESLAFLECVRAAREISAPSTALLSRQVCACSAPPGVCLRAVRAVPRPERSLWQRARRCGQQAGHMQRRVHGSRLSASVTAPGPQSPAAGSRLLHVTRAAYQPVLGRLACAYTSAG